jgi:arylsulfatase A-like enzyme
VNKRSGPYFRTGEALLLSILACVAVFFVVGCSEAAPTQEEEEEGEAEASADRPNIVFVLTDDLDYASVQKMPNLRSLLAERSASFEEAFASQSLCCPSRATILTGLYAHNHNVRGNKLPEGGFEKFRDEGHEENTIAVRLQEEGYRTALFGKYLNEYPGDDPTYVPSGWDEWYGTLDEAKLYDYELNENGEVVSYGNEPGDYLTDVISEKATDFVSTAASDTSGRPFFAYVAPTAPHLPATPAERHEGAFAEEEVPRSPSFDEKDVSDKPSWTRDADRFDDEEISEIDDYYRKRLGSMLAVDEMVASLTEELEATGELENTYIFFTSDNGWFSGEHRIKQGKDRPYEESARVPLFVRGPGIAPGTKVEELALNTDLAPTFAELAGLEGFPADGRTLAPLLRGEGPPWRSSVLLEGFVGRGARVYGAVRSEDYKYVEYGNGEEELYDLRADPYELESLHETADPSLVEGLKGRLEALRECAGTRCQEAEDGP